MTLTRSAGRRRDAVLRLCPVSNLVNKVANDGPELLLLPATATAPSEVPAAVNPA